jgi:hypothetical protein
MTRTCRKFTTGLVLLEKYTDELPPVKSKAWTAHFVKNRCSRTRNTNPESYEVILESLSREQAQIALRLIFSCIHLVMGDPMALERINQEVVEIGKEQQLGDGTELSPVMNSTGATCCGGILQAVMLAAKFAQRRDYRYGVALYHQSCSCHQNDRYQILNKLPVNQVRSVDFFDQVRFAYAIIAAYAVIEQLELEIITSKNQDAMEGEAWNTTVYDGLVLRLVRAGIDRDQKINWYRRTKVLAAQQKRLAISDEIVPWVKPNVKDRMVLVTDAIRECSHLRSKVSSHRLRNERTAKLSVYDVANAQNLARYMLLNVNLPKKSKKTKK